MSWWEIYALFGSPLVGFLAMLFVYWITGVQDRRYLERHKKTPAE